jgi:hypothetical protein
MLNIRMSRTPIEGSTAPGCFTPRASPHFDMVVLNTYQKDTGQSCYSCSSITVDASLVIPVAVSKYCDVEGLASSQEGVSRRRIRRTIYYNRLGLTLEVDSDAARRGDQVFKKPYRDTTDVCLLSPPPSRRCGMWCHAIPRWHSPRTRKSKLFFSLVGGIPGGRGNSRSRG